MQTRQAKIVGAMLLVVALALVWSGPLDKVAQDYTESGLKRAVATFAAARAMNAVISVLQSFQVGVGASVQLGAALDPLDDLVEQFSALMLAAILSFGTQRLLIEISGPLPVSILLTVLFIAWGLLHGLGRAPPGWLPRIALALLLLRFAVPIAALGSEATYRLLLATKYEDSQARIKAAVIPEAEVQAGESFADTVKRWWAQGADVGKKIAALNAKVENWVEHLVRLAAIFIVQTIVLPLLFLWLILRSYRLFFASSGGR